MKSLDYGLKGGDSAYLFVTKNVARRPKWDFSSLHFVEYSRQNKMFFVDYVRQKRMSENKNS